MDKPQTVWEVRWSDRRSKVYYVNLDTRKSSWTKPADYKETQDDLKKIKTWKAQAKHKSNTPTDTQTPVCLPIEELHTKPSQTKEDRNKSQSVEKTQNKQDNLTKACFKPAQSIEHGSVPAETFASKVKKLQESDPKSLNFKKSSILEIPVSKKEKPPKEEPKKPLSSKFRSSKKQDETPSLKEKLPKEQDKTLTKDKPSTDQENTLTEQNITLKDQDKSSKQQDKLPKGQEKTPKGQEKTPKDQEKTPKDQEKARPNSNKTPTGETQKVPVESEKRSLAQRGSPDPSLSPNRDQASPDTYPRSSKRLKPTAGVTSKVSEVEHLVDSTKTPPREYFENNLARAVTPESRTPTQDFGNTPPLESGSKFSKRRYKSSDSSSGSPTSEAAPKKHKNNKTADTKKQDQKLTEIMPDETPESDYIEVFSEKRNMYYYYNLKTKKSQWKKPACLQVAETRKAIDNVRKKQKEKKLKKESVSIAPVSISYTPLFNPDLKFGDFEESDNSGENPKTKEVVLKSKLNVNAPEFQMSRKVSIENTLNVDAPAFIPRNLQNLSPEQPDLNFSLNLSSPERELEETPKISRSKDRPTTPGVTPKSSPRSRNKSGRKVTVNIKRRFTDPTIRRRLNDKLSPEKSTIRKPVKNRLSLPNKRESVDVSPSVHERLGARISSSEADTWDLTVESNVTLTESDLIRLSPHPPPHPDTESFRFEQVQELRNLFADLCFKKLVIEEPTEAFNRWLLEQQLCRIPQDDPVLCHSDKKSVSMYREIMQDIPLKVKLPRSHMTCTETFDKFAGLMMDTINTHGNSQEDKDKIMAICNKSLENNTENSNTRELISQLREECREITDKHYRPIVEELCQEMNKVSRNSAIKILSYAKEKLLGDQPPVMKPPPIPSTNLVCCRPAQPCIPLHTDTQPVCAKRSHGICKLEYKDETISLNNTHFKKLQKLYSISCKDDPDQKLLNVRIWCLMKRYDMLRSSMGSGQTARLSENFGLHAALPTRAFRLLTDMFRVTFECFASPLNCYFRQFCSAFPDIDCYFGSRGSFFDFKPKSGSFQANPPFSEEVMLQMANHMIHLLGDTTEPLQFLVFIPDWQDPLTPAIPALRDNDYCRYNMLLDRGRHQYITGNQHVSSHVHYDAVHGTQVYLLQNGSAAGRWPVSDWMMSELKHAMCSNSSW